MRSRGSLLSEKPPDVEIATWVDAWRGEVYAALYDDERELEGPVVASPDEVLHSAQSGTPTFFIGDGARTIATRSVGRWERAAAVAAMPTPLLAGTIATAGRRADG